MSAAEKQPATEHTPDDLRRAEIIARHASRDQRQCLVQEVLELIVAIRAEEVEKAGSTGDMPGSVPAVEPQGAASERTCPEADNTTAPMPANHHGSFCPNCGWDVPVDEDGCCGKCGCAATGPAVDTLEREWDGVRSRIEQARAQLAEDSIVMLAVEQERDKLRAKLETVDNWRCIGPDAPQSDCRAGGADLAEMCVGCAAAELGARLERVERERDDVRRLAREKSARVEALEREIADITRERDGLRAKLEEANELVHEHLALAEQNADVANASADRADAAEKERDGLREKLKEAKGQLDCESEQGCDCCLACLEEAVTLREAERKEECARANAAEARIAKAVPLLRHHAMRYPTTFIEEALAILTRRDGESQEGA